ncbi:MAG: ribosome small subunit-dependent GTPase A [Cytophagales bacterium]|nr:ribosome small subunit-dependent GTPase A [Cytophagales bacterium]
MNEGIVMKSTGSWYWVRTLEGEVIKCRLRGKNKLVDKKITNPIAVGDRALLEFTETQDWVIKKILDRSNYVIRESPRKRGHHHLIAANIDQAMLITSLRQPKTSLGFIDRFLVTLEAFRIPGIIVINKTDLYNEAEMEALELTAALYHHIGYPTVFTSFQEGEMGHLDSYFKDKTTLLSGHSGTGKSTLVNLMIDEVHQKTMEVSEFADKGVHTTTFAEMFELEQGGFIIDTPGIKELGLAEIEHSELSHYFPEMRQYIGQCRFNNCMHTGEPGCAVMEALEEGEIPESRFESYLSMLENDDNRR